MSAGSMNVLVANGKTYSPQELRDIGMGLIRFAEIMNLGQIQNHAATEAIIPRTEDALFTPKELATFLNVSEITLEKWRQKNKGPRWSHVGRYIRYRAIDVHRWMDTNARGGRA